MKDLEVIIAKYYFPDVLFVGQVEEIISLLTDMFSRRFSHDQAVTKANQIMEKYYYARAVDRGFEYVCEQNNAKIFKKQK